MNQNNTHTSRPPYLHAHLQRMLNPRSIAIIGASDRPGAFGERLQHNLREYAGELFLVNGKRDAIGGKRCYANVGLLPSAPDLAVIVVGREVVEGVVLECIAAGAGGIMIFASGYAETGKPERAAQQARLAFFARQSGIPIIGPNCIGVVNYDLKSRASFSIPADLPEPGPGAVGIVSQSGALGFGLEQSIYRGVAVSHMLNSGNACDVDVADFVNYLADEPRCEAIALLFEGMAEPHRLMQACRYAFSRGKPVVAYKIAVGETGAQAAASHTGALAGSHAAYRAAFNEAGVVVVDKLEALLETARFLAKAPPPQAAGVAVMASSGGAAIMAADFADAHGVAMPQPGPAAQALLDAVIPDFGSARNPVDLTAQVLNDEGMIPKVTEAMLADPAYGALLIPTILSSPGFIPRIPVWSEAARKTGKPVIVVWTTDWLQGPMAMELERDARISLFRSMDRAYAAISAWHVLHARRCKAPGAAQVARLSSCEAAGQGTVLLDRAPGATLTERESKAVLAAYGIPVVTECLAGNAREAVEAAAGMQGPVVLKVESPDLPHKTEAGVIRLNLKTGAEVARAYDEVIANALKVTPLPQVNGVLVQPMVPSGLEIVIGGRQDPLFGPVVVAGLGGVMVELLGDVALGLAPVSQATAVAMLESLEGRALLGGFRGAPPVDIEALAAVVRRASEFLADHRDTVAELDINPLICHDGRFTAVDALIVKRAVPHDDGEKGPA